MEVLVFADLPGVVSFFFSSALCVYHVYEIYLELFSLKVNTLYYKLLLYLLKSEALEILCILF